MNGKPELMLYYLSASRLATYLGPITAASFAHETSRLARSVEAQVVARHLLARLEEGSIRSLTDLAISGDLMPGQAFVHHGRFRGKGFSVETNHTPVFLNAAATEALAGFGLSMAFGQEGLLNDTARTVLGEQPKVLVIGYIQEVTHDKVIALPIAIGDLMAADVGLPVGQAAVLQLSVDDIEQFVGAMSSQRGKALDLELTRNTPEQMVKELIARLLGDETLHKDWGGEKFDHFSSNLLVDGQRLTGAFLLKGPSRFHPMEMTDCGKNGDQLVRLFETPADVYVVQHCHTIGAAVRTTAEALAIRRSLIAPCRIVFMDGYATARLLRKHGAGVAVPSAKPARSRPKGKSNTVVKGS